MTDFALALDAGIGAAPAAQPDRLNRSASNRPVIPAKPYRIASRRDMKLFMWARPFVFSDDTKIPGC
jgi:hypothetical protein